ERNPAIAALRDLVEDGRSIRRHLDAETLAELCDPRELVGARRDHRPALPLQSSLKVDGGAVAFEVARPRQDEVAPAAVRVLEHADADHGLRALCERANALVEVRKR